MKGKKNIRVTKVNKRRERERAKGERGERERGKTEEKERGRERREGGSGCTCTSNVPRLSSRSAYIDQTFKFLYNLFCTGSLYTHSIITTPLTTPTTLS